MLDKNGTYIKLTPSDWTQEEIEDCYFFDVRDCFDNITKDISPIHNFWKIVNNMAGLSDTWTKEEAQEVFENVVVSDYINKELERLQKLWHQAYNNFYADKKIDQFVAMDMLGYSPNSFLENDEPDWMSPNYVFINEKFFEKRRRDVL